VFFFASSSIFYILFSDGGMRAILRQESWRFYTLMPWRADVICHLTAVTGSSKKQPRDQAMARALGVFFLSILLAVSAPAQKPPEVPWVDVELAIQGPNGQPLAHTAITVKVLKRGYFDPSPPDVVVTTDDQGIARFKVPAGVFSMSVTAHRVGHGSVGITEFLPGGIARPQMPPLAAYGSIQGRIPPSSCRYGVAIHVGLEQFSLSPDSLYWFHIDDISGNDWSVWASAGQDPCTDFTIVKVIPGQTSTVDLKPILPVTVRQRPADSTTPAKPNPVRISGGQKPHDSVVWVRGTVRDERGYPVANATVYAVATYSGAIRMYEETAKAATDANGYYEVKGAGGLSFFNATLVATAPGHPPVWAWPEFPHQSQSDSHPPENPVPPTQDLVLPSKGGKMHITVLRDGEPFAGAAVALYLENANLRDIWAAGGGDLHNTVEDIAYPMAKTNSDGTATFDNLLPGRYRILATADGADSIRRSAFGIERPAGLAPGTAAGGVPVRIGQTTDYKLKIYRQPIEGSFRVLRTDNTAYTGTGAVRFGPIDAITTNSSASADSSGMGHMTLGHPGFWRMDFMYRDSPITSFPFSPPYFQASGIIALSPNLTEDPPAFTARHIEAGSARIVVQDEKGNPVHATVDIVRYTKLEVSGTTDDGGVVLFKGLYTADQVGTLSDNYVLQIHGANLVNSEPVNLGKDDEPLPSPQVLRTRSTFVNLKFWEHKLPLAINTQTNLVIRAERLRYVYGVIRSSPKPPIGPWRLSLDQDGIKYGATIRVLPGTGEFVAGPFMSGPVHIYFWDYAGLREVQTTVEVDANQDEPLRFDIDADQYAKAPQIAEKPAQQHSGTQLTTGREAYLGMAGIFSHSTGAKHLTGKVFLSDGRTPAFGAQVLYYEAGSTMPAIFSMTDALGNLHPRGMWRSASDGAYAPQDAPSSPVLVALLPGACGATIQTSPVRPDEPVHLILPPPASLMGRVTVGGFTPSEWPGVIHVLAAYQGKGFLASALDVVTTADADGHFTLAGLTPGTYVIQAALDEIWLSSQATVHVAGTSTRPIKLSIPLPGVPVRIKLRDSSGNPVTEKSITIDRSGPLANLWPREWASDGAGMIYVPTLEAGRHTIRTPGSPRVVTVDVPPIPARPVQVRVLVDQRPN
jgi:protocatechuate 3,4-dioxygenase beta subunit